MSGTYFMAFAVLYAAAMISSVHDTTVLGKPKRSPYFFIMVALGALIWPITLLSYSGFLGYQIYKWSRTNG